MAGMYVQLVLVGAAAVGLRLALLMGNRPAAVILLTFISMTLAIVLFNLVPLIRLDGYWALSAMTGASNLRPRALRTVEHVVMRVVLGVAIPQRPRERGLGLFMFGLACCVFTPAILVVTLSSYWTYAQAAGSWAITVWFAAAAAAVLLPTAVWIRRAHALMRDSRVARGRVAAAVATPVVVIGWVTASWLS